MQTSDAQELWNQDPDKIMITADPLVEKKEEEPADIYVKRYNDMRPEFDRRGNELHELRQQSDRDRLEKMELKQKLQEYELQQTRTGKNISENDPDPLDPTVFYNDRDRQVMEDYPEIIEVTKKIAEHQTLASERRHKDQIRTLEQEINKQKEYLNRNQQSSVESEYHRVMKAKTGLLYKTILNDSNFHIYVSQLTHRFDAINNRLDPDEHFDIMRSFLADPLGEHITRSIVPTEPQAPSGQSQAQMKRDAAIGLQTNSIPQQQKPIPTNKREMWDSININ